MEILNKTIIEFYGAQHFPMVEFEKKILDKFNSQEYQKLQKLIDSDEYLVGNTGSQEPSFSMMQAAEAIRSKGINYRCEIYCYVSILMKCFTIIEFNDISIKRDIASKNNDYIDPLYFPKINVLFRASKHENIHCRLYRKIKKLFPDYKFISARILMRPIPYKINVFNLEKPSYFDALISPSSVSYTAERIIGDDLPFDEFFSHHSFC